MSASSVETCSPTGRASAGGWYACQRALSGTSAGTVQLAIPILTAVGAFALLGEALTAGLAASAALVVAGLLLASRPVHAVAPD